MRTQAPSLVLAALILAAAAPFAAAAPGRFAQLHWADLVHWQPWGPAAFEQARREGKPLLISVGFASCFWCRTLERESFDDPAIAATINTGFVPVLVDRDERPDLDRLYALAADLLAGGAGWPNTLILTPDGAPFRAVGYRPPQDDRFGDPGFATFLADARAAWTNDRDGTLARAASVRQAMARLQVGLIGGNGSPALAPDAWLATAAARLAAGGNAGRSPMAPAQALLLLAARRNPGSAAETALATRLDQLQAGGIHDQLGGGFHRVAVDRDALIPHFEMQTADNAALLDLFADAAQPPATASAAPAPTAASAPPIAGADAHTGASAPVIADAGDTARGILRFLGTLRDPAGGFRTALDAFSDGREGGTFLWTEPELRQVLGPDTPRFLAAYAIASDTPPAPGTPERGVLTRRPGIPPATIASLAPLRDRLLAARNARPQPAPDPSIVLSANGLAIAAIARHAAALGQPEALTWAQDAATRLWRETWDGLALAHALIDGAPSGQGDLADYAEFALGLLALPGTDWHDRAATLADTLLVRFLQPDGTLAASVPTPSQPLPDRDTGDADTPSGTSATLRLLLALSQAPGGERFATAARRLATTMAPAIAAHPDAWPAFVTAAVQGEPVLLATAPDSAAHVHAMAQLRRDPDADRLVVTLTIDPGFHINAHPASAPDLIPTTLEVPGAPTGFAYPPAHRLTLRGTTLDLYDGQVQLAAAWPSGTLGPEQAVHASVTVQACNDRICLPPATIAVRGVPGS